MRADRLLSMLMLLQTKGRMTAEDLAQRLEVSTRTIYRDLDALSIAGVPVYSDRGPGGGISLLDDYRTNLTGLTKNEVQALFMFTVPGLLADLQADKTQKAANLKLVAALPAPYQQDVDWVRQRIHLDPQGWFQAVESTPFLGLVQEAIWQQRRLRVLYRRSDGGWIRRLIDPYGLVAKAGVWYVVLLVTKKIMVYRASRLIKVDILETTFERRQNFNLADYWSTWCQNFEAQFTQYAVQLRVAPEAVAVLAQTFGEGVHDLIKQNNDTDSRGWFELSLSFESPQAACRQLLGLGTDIEVLAPLDLREQMLNQPRNLEGLLEEPGKPLML